MLVVAEGDPLLVGHPRPALDELRTGPAHRVAQLGLVGGERVVDELGHLERVGGRGDAGRVELEHPPVLGVVRARRVRGVDVLGEDRALRHPGLDDHDADAERRELLGEPLGQPLERPLRRDVRRLRQRGDPAGDRGDVDDGPRAPLAHPREHLLQAAHRAAQVDVHQLEVQRRRALLGHGVAADAGVVHQHVDAAGLGEHLGETGAHRLVVGDVQLDELDLHAGLGGHRLQLGGALDAAHRAVDHVALPGEVDGGGPADPAVGSGDDDDAHVGMVRLAVRR